MREFSGTGPGAGTWKRWSTAVKRRELFASSSSFIFVFSHTERAREAGLAFLPMPVRECQAFAINYAEAVGKLQGWTHLEPESASRLVSSLHHRRDETDSVLDDASPVAFACYRLVKENIPMNGRETKHSYKKLSLLYVYELHCARIWRGNGIGTLLLQMMESLGARIGADGVALTCLKNNTEALEWYKHRGYQRAPHCPDSTGKSMYQILWKPFQFEKILER
jgi:ribosomal protein S18 acetylase RimI-like enzyme